MTQKREIKRVLVVDDEASICAMLTSFLHSCGYDSMSAVNPIEALRILEQRYFELCISDIRMAGINGLQLLNEIQKIDQGIDTIIMTGYANDYTYSDIIKAGAADFMAKPFQTQELKAKIERIERERKMRRELHEMNVTLEVLLQRSEREKEELRAAIASNVRELVLPYLEKLKNYRLGEECLAHMGILESNLYEICSSFSKKLSLKHAHLSSVELQVANLIKAGKRNKEIASVLGVSLNTVMTHRYRLRSKLELKRKKVNLSSYLNSINL